MRSSESPRPVGCEKKNSACSSVMLAAQNTAAAPKPVMVWRSSVHATTTSPASGLMACDTLASVSPAPREPSALHAPQRPSRARRRKGLESLPIERSRSRDPRLVIANLSLAENGRSRGLLSCSYEPSARPHSIASDSPVVKFQPKGNRASFCAQNTVVASRRFEQLMLSTIAPNRKSPMSYRALVAVALGMAACGAGTTVPAPAPQSQLEEAPAPAPSPSPSSATPPSSTSCAAVIEPSGY